MTRPQARLWPRFGPRLRAALAGRDGPGRRALPVGVFLHPAPLVALAALAVNDRVLKGSAAPGWLTGKLSDFAGLVFFPLLLATVADVALMGAARLGARVDFSLRRAKLAAACVATGALMISIKLSDAGARAVAGALSAVGVPSAIVADPSDLIALPMLGVAYWLGRQEIARVPLGRLEVLERAHGSEPDGAGRDPGAALERARRIARTGLADVIACGGDPAAVDALADALARLWCSGDGGGDGGDGGGGGERAVESERPSADADAALRALRGA